MYWIVSAYTGAQLLKYSPIVINPPSKSDTILFKLDMNVLNDFLTLPDDLNSRLRAEITAEIKEIPKFSTFTSIV